MSSSSSSSSHPQPIFQQPGPSTYANKPSIFELIAQDQLKDLLQPVVRYILSYFTHRYPRYLIRILNHHEEFYAVVLTLLEGYHLKRHNASLSEHFYGLTLVPEETIPTPRLSLVEPSRSKARKLSKKQRYGMLLVLVGIPYLRTRAQDYYERLSGGLESEESETSPSRALNRSQRLFALVYPYINLAYDFGLLTYDLGYLFDRTRFWRPWYRVLGVTIQRRVDDEDDENQSTGIISNLPPLLPPLLLLLKLSQWWYSPQSPRSLPSSTTGSGTSSTHLKILPPRPAPILPSFLEENDDAPPPHEHMDQPSSSSDKRGDNVQVSKSGEKAGGMERRDKRPKGEGMKSEEQERDARREYTINIGEYGICPLCKEGWKNPAILPSGWVVCWRCGWEAVEENADEEEGDVGDGDGDLRVDGDDDDDDGEGGVNANVKVSAVIGQGRKGRRGRCPITGTPVGKGQLRRVLV